MTRLRTTPEKRNIIRSLRLTLTNDDKNGKIPYGAPIWTLNRAALRFLNWGDKQVPIYDPESDNDENNNAETSHTNRNRKRKRKEKKLKKLKKLKKKKVYSF